MPLGTGAEVQTELLEIGAQAEAEVEAQIGTEIKTKSWRVTKGVEVGAMKEKERELEKETG